MRDFLTVYFLILCIFLMPYTICGVLEYRAYRKRLTYLGRKYALKKAVLWIV